MDKFAFGIDFGTSKTVVTLTKAGSVSPPCDDVEIQGKKRIPTCLLRMGSQVAIGWRAHDEYSGTIDEAKRATFEYDDNFKPALPTGGKDEKSCVDFWNQLTQEPPLPQQLTMYRENAVTIVGRPASWNDQAAEKLLTIAKGAGFPGPFCLPEPVGALFCFMAKQLTAEHCKRNILVIDWGAGTFDFTLMKDGDLGRGEHWGSNLYGGRLFDDLFYMWFLEQAAAKAKDDPELQRQLNQVVGNPSAGSAPDRNLDREFRTYRSRLVKEEFSDWLRTNPEGRLFPSKTRFDHEARGIDLGKLRCQSPQDFMERARNYRPSPYMLGVLEQKRSLAVPSDRPYVDAIFSGRPVDLLAWGRDLVTSGVRNLPDDRTQTVCILTGGSTRWQWLDKLVRDTGKFDDLFVLQDSDPELTIARGLGRAYAIGLFAAEQQQRLSTVAKQMQTRLAQNYLRPKLDQLARLLEDNVFSADRKTKILDAMLGYGRAVVQNRGKSADKAAEDQLKLAQQAAQNQASIVVKEALSSEDLRRDIVARILQWHQEAEVEVQRMARGHQVLIDGLLATALGATHLPSDSEVARAVEKGLGDVNITEQDFWDFLRSFIDWFLKPSAETLAERYRQKFIEQINAKMRSAFRELFAPDDWAGKILAHLNDSLGRIAKLSRGEA